MMTEFEIDHTDPMYDMLRKSPMFSDYFAKVGGIPYT